MIKFQRKVFSNGLVFLHHYDETTPFVVVNLLYKVGAKHEHPDRTGFAHLFEHLMFEGTENVPNYDHPLQEAGGINNAFTNNDFTNYYIKLPKENLELALWLEADRMQHLKFNEDSLSTQKKVVIEEFKENYTNKPYGDVWHILRSMVYEKHPYQWPTIGKEFSHIEEASLEEVQSFFNNHYLPNNAIISVCGNIGAEKSARLVEQLMGEIPDHERLPVEYSDEPAQNQAKFTQVKKKVPLDAIFIVFKMEGRLTRDYYTADLISDVLGNGKSSRLREQLVKKQKLFVSIDAYITGSIDNGLFVFEGKLKEGIEPDVAKAAIWNEIDQIKKNKVAKHELEKVKNKTVTYMAFSENDLLSRAIGLCYYEMLGDPEMINHEERKYLDISADEIQDFVQKNLNESQSTTLYYLNEDIHN